MTVFDDALKITLMHEGGYSNDPADHGGETMYGITKREAVANGYTGDMKTLPMTVAADIYKKKYWTGLPSSIADFMPELAKLVFDCGVNCGPSIARHLLVDALQTFGVTDALKVPAAHRATLRQVFQTQWAQHYLDICHSNPTQMVFLHGWLTRALGIPA